MAKNKTDRDILREHMARINNTFFKPTNYDWAPSYPKNLVRVSKGGGKWDGKDYYNIVIRGMDDCSRVLECESLQHQERIIDILYGCSVITMSMLEDMGFTN